MSCVAHCAQLAMAFPAFSMVTSHHQMENYFGENHSTGHDFDSALPIGSVSYMQLFQAFPAEMCEDAVAPGVMNALQAVQEARLASTTVTAENMLSRSVPDLLKEGDLTHEGADEAKNAAADEDDAEKPPANAQLHAELQKYAFATASPTRFYAYTLLSEDQVTVMNDFAQDSSEIAESSAYIYRYELSVSSGLVDYSVLGQSTGRRARDVLPAGGARRGADADLDTRSDHGSVRGDIIKAGGNARSAGAAPVPSSAEAGGATSALQKHLNAFCVSPVNLAVHRNSTRCTPIQASLEVRRVDQYPSARLSLLYLSE
jgi:hypothetical protein